MKRTLKPLRELGGGCRKFVEELKAAGFEPSVFLGNHSESDLESMWTALRRPCSLDSVHGLSDFVYVSGKWPSDQKNIPGLIFIDRKAKWSDADRARFQETFFIEVKHADAAMDFLLSKLVVREWVETNPHLLSQDDLKKRFPGVICESGVVVGPNTTIAEGSVLESGVRIGSDCQIGRNTRIGAHSTLSDFTEVGDDCVFKSHVVVGGCGFGFVDYPGVGRRTRHHVGRVVIGSRVHLGSFVAVDRGVFDDTVVEDEVVVDNLVQIAHNCRVGRGSLLCSFVGLSGSTDVGEKVTIAGMVGTKGHVRIGNNSIVAAQTGVSKDIPDGQVVKGYPPLPLQESLRIQNLMTKLPEFFDRLKKLEKESEKNA